MPIRFGTDGWRAIIAEDYTFDNVRACAQGIADYLKEQGLAERGVVVGYDTRFASEDFAAAAAEVLAAQALFSLDPGEALPIGALTLIGVVNIGLTIVVLALLTLVPGLKRFDSQLATPAPAGG